MLGTIDIIRKITFSDVIDWKTWLYVIKSSAENGKFNMWKYVDLTNITRPTQPIELIKPLSTEFSSNTIGKLKGDKFK